MEPFPLKGPHFSGGLHSLRLSWRGLEDYFPLGEALSTSMMAGGSVRVPFPREGNQIEHLDRPLSVFWGPVVSKKRQLNLATLALVSLFPFAVPEQHNANKGSITRLHRIEKRGQVPGSVQVYGRGSLRVTDHAGVSQ